MWAGTYSSTRPSPTNTTTDHLVEQVQRRKAPDTTFYEDDILLTLSERAVFFS